MAAVPAWSAARAGLLGDTGAVNHAAQADQLLGAHPTTVLYAGTQILTPTGTPSPASASTDPQAFWPLHMDVFDYDQPFTMSGTKIGRVAVPVLPVGAGADLQVSLCPDSSGVPGAPIVSVRIPAEWIAAFGAAAGVAGAPTALQLAEPNGPLALPQYNTPMLAGATGVAWSSPASSGAAAASNPSSLVSGDFFVQIGGTGAGGAPVANVFTIGWAGDGVLDPAVPQPALPQAALYAAVAATPDTLVCAGGTTTAGGAVTASVFTAGWNPATGVVSAWTAQASLPQALTAAYAAASGETVYVVGGANSGGTALSTVYYATIANGQLQAWTAATPLPVAVNSPYVAAVNGFLVVAGGYLTSYATPTSGVFYAAINADGSLGSWQVGPSLPTAGANIGNDVVVTDAGFAIMGGDTSAVAVNGQHLTVGPTGPGFWRLISGLGSADAGAFQVGAAQWRAFVVFGASYTWQDLFTVPMVSVPLPASGLTNGATYHILLSQVGGDAGDYLRLPYQLNVFPGNPQLLYRARNTATWNTLGGGAAIPVAVYDQGAGGQPWHTWDDSGARISTLAWSTTPDQQLLGVAEAVAQPGPVLNSNPTFTFGTGPWTATGGALTQSSAHVQGALPSSGLLTPTGAAATSSIASEQVAVSQGRAYAATAWLFSPVGYASVAVNISWYNSAHTLLSTTSGTVTALAAGAWTQYSTTGTAPSTAAYATIVPAETGTPPSSALLYVSAATLQDTVGSPLASIAVLGYGGTWPSAAAALPLSVSQLA